MSNSIITNPEAFVALRNLERTNEKLSRTQERLSTGLKVTSATDDASNFAIAQGVRGDVRALSAITQGLNNSKGIGEIALAGVTDFRPAPRYQAKTYRACHWRSDNSEKGDCEGRL